MADRQVVQPQLRATPTDPGPAAAPMPRDVLADAVGRLRLACAVWIVLLVTAVAVNHLIVPRLHLPAHQVVPWTPVADALAVGCILISALVYWYAGRTAGRPDTLANLGIAHEVALAFAIGVINQWEPNVLAGHLSWICALILLYPTIVPAAPRKVLIGSLLAASMDPVGLLMAHVRGVELPGLATLVWAYLANYICAGLAVIPAYVLARLSRQVSYAREMGSYRLGELIGEGGMGQVYHARHRLLARPAAIKLIRPEGIPDGDPSAARLALQRFRREAEAAASLRSPHTIQLYDFGVTDDGRFYLVMEMLDGIDLESLVQRFGPLPPARVIHLLRQACHSLAEAHAAGLVHRDIKPANLHVCRLGLEYDFLKVLDFGLVKHDTRSASVQTMVSGSDLYSLGCVGYFLLTGMRVFEADTALVMIGQHLQAAPVPPSLRSGRAVPADLERMILACLAKRPSDRPATAQAFHCQLSSIDLAPWGQEEARAWWETNLGSRVVPPKVVFSNPGTTRVEVPLSR
jgi:hypothetical protein